MWPNNVKEIGYQGIRNHTLMRFTRLCRSSKLSIVSSNEIDNSNSDIDNKLLTYLCNFVVFVPQEYLPLLFISVQYSLQ